MYVYNSSPYSKTFVCFNTFDPRNIPVNDEPTSIHH